MVTLYGTFPLKVYNSFTLRTSKKDHRLVSNKMSSSFKRNAIIAGYINSYCLVCECFFETEEETISHIITDEHKIKLQCYPYLEKYRNNGVRKVKAGYFCDYCSRLMPTAAKVNLHISEKVHYYNKGNCSLKQSGSNLTAFDNVAISNRAWHSITDDMCAMCDVEFDDENDHKMERSHVLKLIQNKVEFGDSNNLYRKIDKNDIQCLTCNCVIPMDSLKDHFNDDNHQQLYALCQDEKTKFDHQNTCNDIKVDTAKDEAKQVTEIIKEAKTEEITRVIYCQNNDIPVNIKDMKQPTNNKETVAGSIAVDSKEPAKHEEIETKHPDIKVTKVQPIEPKKNNEVTNQKKSEPSTSKTSTTDEKVVYAKENNLLYNPRMTNAYCEVCQIFPSTFHGMKTHVSGQGHTHKMKPKPAQKNKDKTETKLETITMSSFVKIMYLFENTLDKDLILNDAICLTEKSCHMITKARSGYQCQCCEEYISLDALNEHCMTAKHERELYSTLIIKIIGNEFIRQVRPDIFHCGFCNIIIKGWPDVEDHLKTSDHKASSADSSRRYTIHYPSILAHKEMRQRGLLTFANQYAMYLNKLRHF